jgi:hypothetical protein
MEPRIDALIQTSIGLSRSSKLDNSASEKSSEAELSRFEDLDRPIDVCMRASV